MADAFFQLGCGTGLPSLALFQWATAMVQSGQKLSLDLVLADYNPTVLYLVTLPNFIISWALQSRDHSALLQEALTSDTPEGELEITPELIQAFKSFLATSQISVSFCSGAWSPEFVDLLYSSSPRRDLAENLQTVVLGAETIYSPFALASFSDTLLAILQREKSERPLGKAAAIVGAKKLYFGVGGSLDDFVERMKSFGLTLDTLREEVDGVRRGVVRCVLS
jgi:protein-histidine N-methyltransferase